MSWVDLAALVIVLWGAAKGYISGLWHSLVQLAVTIVALPVAFIIHKPLVVFLNQEWQAETVLVGWYLRHSQNVLTTLQAGSRKFSLPPVTTPVLRLFIPEASTFPVISADATLRMLGILFLRMASFAAVLLFIIAAGKLFLRIHYVEERNKRKEYEWQKMWGFMIGGVHGFALSLIACIALDAVSLLLYPGFWESDLMNSFLAKAAGYCLQFIPY